jgi:hypothetical protein
MKLTELLQHGDCTADRRFVKSFFAAPQGSRFLQIGHSAV